MIVDMQSELKRVAARTDQMYRALLEKGTDGSDPFMTRTGRAVTALESGSWGLKWLVRIVLTIGALIIALTNIRGAWPK